MDGDVVDCGGIGIEVEGMGTGVELASFGEDVIPEGSGVAGEAV